LLPRRSNGWILTWHYRRQLFKYSTVADDDEIGLLLFASIISGLRALYLRTCENCLNNADMCVNVNKITCIRFGRRYRLNTHCTSLTTVSGGIISWVDCCRYLGVFFNSCNFYNAKSCFSERLMLCRAKLAD